MFLVSNYLAALDVAVSIVSDYLAALLVSQATPFARKNKMWKGLVAVHTTFRPIPHLYILRVYCL